MKTQNPHQTSNNNQHQKQLNGNFPRQKHLISTTQFNALPIFGTAGSTVDIKLNNVQLEESIIALQVY
jgi:hypothetical protein